MSEGYRAVNVCPPGYAHARVFAETLDAFNGALVDAKLYGYSGRLIAFGAHVLVESGGFGSRDPIIMNTEVPTSPWFTPKYLSLLREHEVWDYAAENVAWLATQGIAAKHCPIGYHRSLTRLTLEEPSIDCLFYGAKTERRLPILKAVWETGLKCVFLDHTDDWSRRDHYLPRTKILLNIHAYDNAPLEMVRISYALANGVFVLTEGDEDTDEFGLVPYIAENLAEGCVTWCEYDESRRMVADKNKLAFSQRLQADILREVLGGA